jgi:hypothetical protein
VNDMQQAQQQFSEARNKKRHGTIAVLIVAEVAAACGGAAGTTQRTTMITIADAPHGKSSAIDLGPPGDSQGDLFVFDQPLLDQGRAAIGNNSGFCVRSQVGNFSECQWTLTLAGGTITLAGREAERGMSRITVVGGSGVYAGVRGEVVSTPNADRTFTQSLYLMFP